MRIIRYKEGMYYGKHIDNVIQANILAALTTSENSLNEIYNIALGDRTSLNELQQLISKYLNLLALYF